jgi:hypothetical protein
MPFDDQNTPVEQSTSVVQQDAGQVTQPQISEGITESQTSPQPGIQAPVAPEWTPNFKYKAGGAEKELPEWVRPAVKNAEHEKYLRELHEKIDGFDKLKSTHTKVDTQLKQVLPEYQTLKGTVNKVLQYREAGDLESVFDLIGVKKQAVAQWMLKEIQMQEMSPEQRAIYESEKTLRQQNYALQERLASLSQNAQQGELQASAQSLQTELARPEVRTIADSFNSRMANPDAFWNFVCQQAEYMERSGGKPVSAAEAVSEVIKLLGNPVLPGQAQPGAPQIPGAQAASPTPPVIPNVSSRNTSPTKKLARSVEDLRKMSKEMRA